MAKKSFKKGLGSLIQNSRQQIEEQKKDTEKSLSEKELEYRISQLEKELHLWRSGKINKEIFEQSIKEHGLKYDSEKNIFEEI